MWQQNQYVSSQINSQWQQKQTPQQDVPISMWDMPISSLETNLPLSATTNATDETKQKEMKIKDSKESKEKKKKEQEDKIAKKEMEEKRKQEQKKQVSY